MWNHRIHANTDPVLILTFFQPHYVPDNYKRNGGRSAWKTERPKGAGGCEDEGSSCERGEDFQAEVEDGRQMEDDMDIAPEDPELVSVKSRRAEQEGDGDEDGDEEEDEGQENEEHKQLEEGSTERIGEMLELPSSSAASSPLHLPTLGRREAQRERLNKILLDLLHRTPNKNGEGPGTKQGGRSTNKLGLNLQIIWYTSFSYTGY